MDALAREALQARKNRHQPSRAWRLVGRKRCHECGLAWPCYAWSSADRALRLDTGNRPQWMNLATQPTPTVGPLMTPGQEYRSRWPNQDRT